MLEGSCSYQCYASVGFHISFDNILFCDKILPLSNKKKGIVKDLKDFLGHFFPKFIRFGGKKLQSFPIWTTQSIYNIRGIPKYFIALSNL
jgi:hypothetical protein